MTDSSQYRGFQTHADDGNPCLFWRDTDKAGTYEETNANYCRNIDNSETTIWCYTGNFYNSTDPQKSNCSPLKPEKIYM